MYAKAIAAFFTALGTWGATALADNGIAGAEWFGLCGVIVATVAVFQIPNQPPTDEHDRGAVDYGPVVVVLLVAILAVLLLAANTNLDF